MSTEIAELYFENSKLRATDPTVFNDVLDANPVLSEVDIEAIARAKCEQLKAQGKLSDEDYDRALWQERQSVRRDTTEENTNVKEIFRVMAFAFICFCRSGRHPLMWTHYADKHQGVQLEFDEQHACFAGKLHNIVYLEERPILTRAEMSELTASSNTPDLVAPSFFFQKALEWSYEQEVRLCLRSNEIERTPGAWGAKGLYGVPFTALRSVTFGNRSHQYSANLRKLIRAVVEREKLQIKAYEVRVSSTEYKLEKHEIQLND
ncbi:DUF2971 domain-containing protein [Hydrogenophaga sp.]|uniref:DUF2971 domain-containing protein n=1 Tax=Hydrogenophaga sp. TaxID=1904254 RepID=UPI003D10B3D8